MIGYKYDNDGYLIGEIYVQESPLEPGILLMPPNTSLDAPPKVEENEIQFYNGIKWIIKPNFSKKVYYSKIDKTEKNFLVGEEFDNNYTDKTPPIEYYKEWNESLNDWIDNVDKLNEYKIKACKNEAKSRIAQLDWVIDEETQPRLLNKSEFIAYRSALRSLIINPQVDPGWPIRPQEVWE